MLRNTKGGLAMVMPDADVDHDIAAHAGAVVACIEYGDAFGGDAWQTFPVLREANGLAIAWHDDDLLPLGRNPDKADVMDLAFAS